MNTWLTDTVENVLDFSGVLNTSITASWLVLAVICLRFFLKQAPKWTHAVLWGLVAVRLILPFSIESEFCLIPSIETVPQEILRYQGEQLSNPAYIAVVSNPVFSENVTIELEQNAGRVQIKMIIWTLNWLVGIAGMLIYLFFSYLRIFFQIRSAKRFRNNIYTSDSISSPFVFGVIRPRICLPDNMDAVNMSYVIAHEEAHIHRRDHLWKPLGYLLLTVHWFNPLLWISYILFCRDIEMACDECVVKDYTDIQRADYSEALLECSMKRKTISVGPLAFGEVGVKTRIRSVLNYRKPTFCSTGLAMFACIMTAACFLTNPITDEEERRMDANEYIEQTQTVSIQEQNTTSETRTNDLASVKEYAEDIIASAAKTMFGSVYMSGIQNLEQVSVGNSIISEDVLLYRLEYWIKEGIEHPDRADSEDTVLEEVYFALLYDRTVETWTRLGVLLR